MTRRSGGGAPVKLIHSSGKELDVDWITSAGETICVEHHMIHESKHFFADDYDASVDNASPKYWLLITPNTSTRIHFTFKGVCSGGGLWEIFRDGIIAEGNEGTPIVVVNNDENSNTAATLLVYSDPTTGGDGTRIAVELLPSEGKKEGALSERERELILKVNTKYLIKFTPDGNGTGVNLNPNWYEVS